MHPKTRRFSDKVSESNDNRTRRHPVDLLAGHLFLDSMSNQKPRTIEEQFQLLRSRGMVFSNEEEALKQLTKEFETAKVDMDVEDNEDDEYLIVEDDIATDKCFSIYEDGCYSLNHISGSIREYEVKDKA